MRFRTLAGILTVSAAAALILGQVAAQRQVHKSTQVTIVAETLEYDLTTDVFVMAGGCAIDIADAQKTHLTSPRVTITPEKGERRAISVEAAGPVAFSRVLDTGEGGRRVNASCSRKATYSERTGLGQLLGDVRVKVSETPGAGDVATITGDALSFALRGGEMVLKGGCDVTIVGTNDAHMTADTITMTPDRESGRVVSIEGKGPVTLDATVTKEDGQKSHVKARCVDIATYSEETMLAELVGDVHVEISSVPATEGFEALQYDGGRMTFDLKNQTFSLTEGAAIDAEMTPDAFGSDAHETEPEVTE